MKRMKTDARRTCLERLFDSSKRDCIAKAIVVENGQVYTYGYDRVHKA